MKIVETGNNKYIDQQLFDHINTIWLNFDVVVNNDSNLLFAKNTTVNRLITDYSGTGISRVIKVEKADYIVINRFALSSYPQYFDGVNITTDDTKEVVYGIYNMNLETQDVIELILNLHLTGSKAIFVNQNKLNESLNNGFVIDKENYITFKELIDSEHSDNYTLAANMLIQSDLKQNWQWILYLYHNSFSKLSSFDNKNIIYNYFSTLNLGQTLTVFCKSMDSSLSVITDEDVKIRMIHIVKEKFERNIQEYFEEIGTKKFKLDDFKITYDASK
jgi:hypothetical protein